MNCHLQLLKDSRRSLNNKPFSAPPHPLTTGIWHVCFFHQFFTCGTLEDRKLRIIWEGVLSAISHISEVPLYWWRVCEPEHRVKTVSHFHWTCADGSWKGKHFLSILCKTWRRKKEWKPKLAKLCCLMQPLDSQVLPFYTS